MPPRGLVLFVMDLLGFWLAEIEYKLILGEQRFESL